MGPQPFRPDLRPGLVAQRPWGWRLNPWLAKPVCDRWAGHGFGPIIEGPDLVPSLIPFPVATLTPGQDARRYF
ncbi:hypothetical protein HNR10_001591 [Nocardiopsis aegyptia]|uniref:Uncharacterized protein n=1 Tax=Nocardiopsis aegyptia TaxID=220378 RepID=A0A7Z0EKE1_9ACTN|nr:hypothetical protein [Nocardiopsis aegyptia]